jgi:uncharacterized protein (DUF885 family)
MKTNIPSFAKATRFNISSFRFKKVLAFLLALITVFVIFAGCAKGSDDNYPTRDKISTTAKDKTPANADFETFVNDFLVDSLEATPFYINFIFKNPSAFGISSGLEPSFGNGYVYPSEDEIASDRALIAQFYSFNRETLNFDQKMVYDLMDYDFSSYDKSLEFFYYREPLVNGDGEHASLPLDLGAYKINNKQNISDFFGYVKAVDTYFVQIFEFEKQKANFGLFMTERNLNKVIEECRAIIKNPDNVSLIAEFKTNLENASGFSAEEKNNYTDELKALIKSDFIPAYEKLIANLETLRGKCGNNGGLAYLPKGQEYYKYKMNLLGLSMTPEKLIELLDKELETNMRSQVALYNNDLNIESKAAKLWEKNKTGTETLDYLKQKAVDFPALPENTKYEVRSVDKSLEDSARPAMYYKPYVDDTSENIIYINNKSLSSDPVRFFTTMAHEGYPGHLQQFVGLYTQNISVLRKIYSYTSNSEGWATYAEYFSVRYLNGDDNVKEFARLSDEFNLLIQTRVEMGIAFEGWSYEAVGAYFEDLFGFDLGYTQEGWEYSIDNPIMALPYAGGLLEIRALRSGFPSTTDLAFHSAFVGVGSIPFSLMKSYLSNL